MNSGPTAEHLSVAIYKSELNRNLNNLWHRLEIQTNSKCQTNEEIQFLSIESRRQDKLFNKVLHLNLGKLTFSIPYPRLPMAAGCCRELTRRTNSQRLLIERLVSTGER